MSRDGEKRVHERRALVAGFAISLVVHLTLILLYGSAARFSDRAVTVRAPSPADLVWDGIEIVSTTELEPEPIEEPEVEPPPVVPEPEEEPEPEPEEPAPAPEPLVATAPAPGDPEEEPEPDRGTEVVELTVAERLQPRMGDPRLWAGVDRHYSELTDFERADLLLRGMIQSWNDSVAVAEALANRGRDWTYTDADGRRWGLASGRLYLGDFSIPLPFSFQVSPGQRQAWAERQWISQDLMQGAAAAQIRETWADRARAIRERLEAERDAARGATSDGG